MVSVPSTCQQLTGMRSDVVSVVTLTGKRDTTQSMIYYDLLSFVVIAVNSVYKSIIYCCCFTHIFHPDLELKGSFKV